jgi:hypothetical protein
MKKWPLRHLLISWFAYWAGITAIKLGSAFAAAWTATRGADDGRSGIDLGWDSASGLRAVVRSHGETIWTGATSISALVGWAVIPPLILWVIWLRLSSADRSSGRARAELGSGDAADLPLQEKPTSIRERR